MIYEKSAGAIIFKKGESQLKFLLLEAKSISTKNPHTIWSFPKGNVEKDETDMQVAQRETYEEAGLTDLNFIPNFKVTERFMYRRDNELVSKTANYFLAETKEDQIKLSEEHINFAWLTLEEALGVIKIKAIRESLNKAHSFIVSGAVQKSML